MANPATCVHGKNRSPTGGADSFLTVSAVPRQTPGFDVYPAPHIREVLQLENRNREISPLDRTRSRQLSECLLPILPLLAEPWISCQALRMLRKLQLQRTLRST